MSHDDIRDYDERMGGPSDLEAEDLRDEGRREILREIAEILEPNLAAFYGPAYPNEKPGCFFCGEEAREIPGTAPGSEGQPTWTWDHADGCLWLRAKKALES